MALGAKHGFDSPQAILEGAIESEKDSILFYSALASATQDENSRVVFREIERQERGHLNQLTQMLSRMDASPLCAGSTKSGPDGFLQSAGAAF